MECPYCKKEMREGCISAYRSAPVWEPKSAEISLLPPDTYVRLADPDLFASKQVESWLCEDCRVLITPVKEYQTTWDKMKDKWKHFTERRTESRERQAEERQEEQQEKAREKRRKKDPWEV